MKDSMIKSFINYTGGKYRLLNQILPLFPKDITNFVDLFAGSGVVGINATEYIKNIERITLYDINKQLVDLMNWVKSNDIDSVNKKMYEIIKEYNLSNTGDNGYEYYGVNSSIGLANINRNGYIKLRDQYNSVPDDALLYALVVYGFNNQIRFNRKGQFNNPVGKRDFNKSMLDKLIKFSDAVKKFNVDIECCDFRDVSICDKMFFYVDPPYLISTASYNENGGWTEEDEKDLLKYLEEVDRVGSKFALSNVLKLKGESNDILYEWLNNNDYVVHHLNMNYNNSNYHKKRTGLTDEVLITNYCL